MTQIATVIVGSKFRPKQAREALTMMKPGTEIRLRRDPNNAFDAYAIECHFLGQHVGFIPRQANPEIARAMDSGVKPIAIVTEPGRIDNGRVAIEPKIRVRWGE